MEPIENSTDEARIRAAIRNFGWFENMKKVFAAVLTVALLIVAIAVFNAKGLLWAVGAFILGMTLGQLVIVLVVVLPPGYAFFGRDAMRVGRLV